MVKKARIIGLSSYLPSRILSNLDLEKIVDTSDEWITTRTGMKERRLAREDEYSSDMGYEAAKRALEAAHVAATDIDAIIVATLTPDYPTPSTAALIQARLGATRASAVDIQAACVGYLYALLQAKAYVEAGIYQHVLVIASEKLSSVVDYKDRNTCVLFGDGAAAAVVAAEGKGLAIEQASLGADGQLAPLLIIPGGGSRNPAMKETIEQGMHYIKMTGKEIFKHAVRRMASSAQDCLEKAKLTMDDIKWLVPHQANIRIISAVADSLGIPEDKAYITVHKYGNTSASSVGIALDELVMEKGVAPGDNLLLVSFGAGLTWGAIVLQGIEG